MGLDNHRWLGDHRVAGQVVVPGAAVAELVRAAAAHGSTDAPRVRGLVLEAPLVLPEKGARRVQVVLAETAEGAVSAAVYSSPAEGGPGAGWTQHATASVESTDVPGGRRRWISPGCRPGASRRWTSRRPMRASPRRGLPMALPSRGCAPCGAGKASRSPRWCCPRPLVWRERRGTACIPRCSTPRCRQWQQRRRRRSQGSSRCPSRSAALPCTSPGWRQRGCMFGSTAAALGWWRT